MAVSEQKPHHTDIPLNSVVGDVLYIPQAYVGGSLAAKATTIIRRKESGEVVYTNSRGWRTGEATEKHIGRSDILVTGCSFPMGTGVPYGVSQIGLLEEALGVNIANVLVGGYSILQSARRAEKELPASNAKIAVLPLLSGIVNRCLKENHVQNVIFRPVYKKFSNGNLNIIEPIVIPLSIYLNYALWRRKGSWAPNLFGMDPFQLTVKLLNKNKLRNLAARASGTASKYMSSFDLEARRRGIEDSVEIFVKACEKNGARGLICHLFDFAHYYQDQSTKKIQDFDRKLLEELEKKYSVLQYESWDLNEKILTDYLSKRDATILDYKDHIFYSDNNHPNVPGQKLIFEYLKQSVEKHF